MRLCISALLSLVLASLSSCGGRVPLKVLANASSPRLECSTVEELLALSEEQLDIGHAALVIQEDFADKPGYQGALDELDELARGFGQPASDDAVREGQRLLDYLYNECGFVYGEGSRALNSRLLAHVLETREGNCVGLSTLYLAVGERVGLDLSGVLVPGHMYVELERGSESIGLEPTNGELQRAFDGPVHGLPDDEYREASRRGVPLTKRETLSMLLADASIVAMDSYYALNPVRYALQAVECDPRFPLSLRTLGRRLSGLATMEGSLAAFSRALELNPRDTDARLERAQIFMSIGRQAEALPDLRAALQVEPENPLVHWLLARIHAEKFEWEAMFAELDRVLGTPWDEFGPEYRFHIERIVGERLVFEGSVWGYLAEKHKFAAKRLTSEEQSGEEVDQEKFRLHMACADLAGRITDTLAGFQVPPSKLDATVDSNPKLAKNPRILRYRAALEQAQALRAK